MRVRDLIRKKYSTKKKYSKDEHIFFPPSEKSLELKCE